MGDAGGCWPLITLDTTNVESAITAAVTLSIFLLGRPKRRPLPNSGLPNAGTWRRWIVERHDLWLPAVGTGAQHHPVRLNTHQLRRFQIEHNRDGAANERLGLISFRDASH